MDPTATLTAADQAISDCDADEASYLLNEYAAWRARGGYEPVEVAGTLYRGDIFAEQCWRRLESLIAQQRSVNG